MAALQQTAGVVLDAAGTGTRIEAGLRAALQRVGQLTESMLQV